jgi:hypothetical protein
MRNADEIKALESVFEEAAVKSRDVVIVFVTAVVFAGMQVFVSCSSQQPRQEREEEDLMALSVAEVSDHNREGEGEDPLLGEPSTATAESTTNTERNEPVGTMEGGHDKSDGAFAERSAPSHTRNTTVTAPLRRSKGSTLYSGGTYIAAVPIIPAKAIRRGDTLLNRFYFVRPGDTRASVATLLYGDKGRAADLARWNSGFRPGKVLYYQSAGNPGDEEMRSFYQERNVPGEEYVVRSGDWLSKIAQRRFRSPWSWTEIAVTNGIDRPERIAKGTKIFLYPVDLSSFRTEGAPQSYARTQPANDVAEKSRLTPPPVEPAGGEAPTVADNEPLAGLPPTNPAAGDPIPDAGSVEPFTKGRGKSEALDLMQLLEQNLFLLGLGALALMLLLVLMAVSRRRKQMEAIEDEPIPVGVRAKR